jgi:hypothetical protein
MTTRLRRAVGFIGHYDAALLAALWTVWLAWSVTDALVPSTPTVVPLVGWSLAVGVVLATAARHSAAACPRCRRRRQRLTDQVGAARARRWRLALTAYHHWPRIVVVCVVGMAAGALLDVVARGFGVLALMILYVAYVALAALTALHQPLMPWCRRCQIDIAGGHLLRLPPPLAGMIVRAEQPGTPSPMEFGWTDETGQRWYHPPGAATRTGMRSLAA